MKFQSLGPVVLNPVAVVLTNQGSPAAQSVQRQDSDLMDPGLRPAVGGNHIN